jgi:GntR family transcriptional repressor for pyruvate dehydrogenase complex
MSFKLTSLTHTKLHTSIVDQIVEGIRSGAFAAGSALPSERTLAKELGVSRHSVREAIRVLESAGVIQVRVGSGTYVTEAGLSTAPVIRARTALSGELSPIDIMVARSALESVAAREAARFAQDIDLSSAREAIEEQASFVAKGDDALASDFRFHVAISRASHNPVVLTLVEQLLSMMRQVSHQDFFHRLNVRPGTQERYLTQHRSILAAIEGRDPGAAHEAMTEHLRAVGLDLAREAEPTAGADDYPWS